MSCIVYALIDNVGNIRYIGQTTQALEKRLYDHIRHARQNKTHLHYWINKQIRLFGHINHIILEDNATHNCSEIFWIISLKYLDFDLVNSTFGGEGAGIGNKNAVDNTSRRGKKHSPEAKAKMSKTRKGKIPTGYWAMIKSDNNKNNCKKVLDTETNIEYSSIAEAAKSINITHASMCDRLRPKKRKPNRFVCTAQGLK